MNIRYRSLAIGTVGHVRCERSWRMDRAWSRLLVDCDLFYIWAGEGKMCLRDAEVLLKPGVCILMRPGGNYTAEHNPDNPLGVTYIHFVPRDSQGRICLSDDTLPPEYHEITDPVFFSVVSEKIVRLCRRRQTDIPASANAEDDCAAEQATALLGSLLAELERAATLREQGSPVRYREQIEKQIAQIYEQPTTVPSVATLARQLSLSKDHYTRVFRGIAGVSPRDLIQEARLDRACRLLKETSLTVSEIADQVGYCDLYQFSRVFKQRMGRSPSTWRAS